MAAIAGQKPVVTVARKSVAGFKIRDGYPIGCKVTLRRARMYEFLERLINIAIPRQRDFRGLSRSPSTVMGNYSMGFSEQIVFPEIDYDKVDTLRGLDINITTTAKNDEEGRALLAAFNFPFRTGRTSVMAKKSMVEREAKRAKRCSATPRSGRAEGNHQRPQASEDDKLGGAAGLQKLPRNASPVRQQRRCRVTGRPHGFIASSVCRGTSFGSRDAR